MASKASDASRSRALAIDHIRNQSFPCIGAKSALAGLSFHMIMGGDLETASGDRAVLNAVQALAAADHPAPFESIVAIYPNSAALTELEFEAALWRRLQALHDLDVQDFDWDADYSQDPASAGFGFSLGGQAFFIVGMNPAASRISRRSPFPAIAFNPHRQFERSKLDGGYPRLRALTRVRDVALQGDVNPMLSEFGRSPEPRQYSGRHVDADWACPIQVRQRTAKCSM